MGACTSINVKNNQSIQYPVKKREFHNHHFDSTIWNEFRFRDDDIIIATYSKAGTTWTQQIIGQMLFGGDPTLSVPDISPWMDLRVPPKEIKLPKVEEQRHRRFVKTHLPVDALTFSPKAKYVYVARDGRDVLWSLFNHHSNANADWYAAMNDTPGRVGPPIERPRTNDVCEYFNEWMEKDGYPFWPFWEHIRGWWEIRHLPNVYLLHFENLKQEMPGEMRKLAAYLGIPIDESRWDSILKYCSFEWMKNNAPQVAPLGGIFWDGGASNFIFKGTNGRWRDTLSPAAITSYEARAVRELGAECAAWLATGRRSDRARA